MADGDRNLLSAEAQSVIERGGFPACHHHLPAQRLKVIGGAGIGGESTAQFFGPNKRYLAHPKKARSLTPRATFALSRQTFLRHLHHFELYPT